MTGTLRGYDQFMNLVLADAMDEGERKDIGMVVSFTFLLMENFHFLHAGNSRQ